MYLRISNYYQSRYIIKTVSYSAISRAIEKYGIYSFSLVILKLNPVDLSQAEQNWINTLVPEYYIVTNVLIPHNISTRKPYQFGANNSLYFPPPGGKHEIIQRLLKKYFVILH